MKERPILFSAPMVRAILAGTKTQTRRALAPDLFMSSGGAVVRMASAGPATTGIREAHCPYWREPGDRLWVRETWREWSDAAWHYAADGLVLPKQRDRELAEFLAQRAPFTWESYTWRPSIHMPRWASRITLEVTGVRVERLQDISEADATAEGTPCYVCDRPMDGRSEDDCHCFHRRAAASDYRMLWESINGPGSWDANPWCWVIEFRRVS